MISDSLIVVFSIIALLVLISWIVHLLLRVQKTNGLTLVLVSFVSLTAFYMVWDIFFGLSRIYIFMATDYNHVFISDSLKYFKLIIVIAAVLIVGISHYQLRKEK